MQEDLTNLFSVEPQRGIRFSQVITGIIGYVERNYVPDLEFRNQDFESHETLVCKIPFVLRGIGVPSGDAVFVNRNLLHMLGIRRANNSQNLHDLIGSEISRLPDIICNPDAIFRSNTRPNESILICVSVLNERHNPTIFAAELSYKDKRYVVSIASGYEKSTKPETFFYQLYDKGYCLYTSETDEYFTKFKELTGAITPTKKSLINMWLNNNKCKVLLFADKSDIPKMSRALKELGFDVISPSSYMPSLLYKTMKKVDCVAATPGSIGTIKNLIFQWDLMDDIKVALWGQLPSG